MQTVPLLQRLRRHHGIDQRSGVLVTTVAPDGPAARAGLQEDDVLLTLDGEPLPGTDALYSALTPERAGRTLPPRPVAPDEEDLRVGHSCS